MHVRMKKLKATLDVQNEDQSSGVGKGMRGKNSNLRGRGYVHCQNVIFGFAAVVLITFFIQQVSIVIRIYFVLSSYNSR